MARLLTVQLLGRFRVTVDGRDVPDEAWTRRRAAALVKLLALAPSQRLPRETAMDALWPELGTKAAGANLRKAAHFARRILEVPDSIVLTREVISLLPNAHFQIDAEQFEVAARNALAAADPKLCRQAAALYGGELLPDDRYEPWCEGVREELRGLYRALLVAGEQWGRLLDLDHASELAHREIMRERLVAGDRAGAIRQFDQMRAVLRDELGVGPGPESVALYEQVLAVEEPSHPTPAERARALLAWGTIHWERSDLQEAERTAAEARALAVDSGLGRELSDASELLGLIAYAQGRWREVFAEEFLRTVERTPDLAPFVVDAHLCMSEFALHEADGMPAVGDFAGRLLEIGERTGSAAVRALALLLRGEVELLRGGDLGAAGRNLRDSLRLHEEAASRTGAVIARERLAQTAAFSGEVDEARRIHREALDEAGAGPVAHHLIPLIYGGLVESTPPEAVLDVVAEGEAALRKMRPCRPCSMSFHLGSALAYTGSDEERAHSHLTEAEDTAGMWRAGAWHAAVTEAKALLLLADDASAPEARALLEDAAERFAAAERARDEARCRSTLTRLS